MIKSFTVKLSLFCVTEDVLLSALHLSEVEL